MFKQVDHIGIATRDIEASLATLKKMGPVTVGAREAVPAYQLEALMVVAGDVPIELIQPTSPDSTIAAFIEKRGEGVHHIAYRVADVAAALAHCVAQGLRPIDAAPRHGYADSRVAFLHPKSTLGMLTELVERPAGKDEPPYEKDEG
jgi:methylmalonyl-CoA epimerase